MASNLPIDFNIAQAIGLLRELAKGRQLTVEGRTIAMGVNGELGYLVEVISAEGRETRIVQGLQFSDLVLMFRNEVIGPIIPL